MTCKELLFFIDDQQKILQPTAFKLLVHLVAIGIRHSTNSISISTYALAEEIHVVRDTLAEASRELRDAQLVSIVRPHNAQLPKRYIMPAGWFTEEPVLESPPLFSEVAGNEEEASH